LGGVTSSFSIQAFGKAEEGNIAENPHEISNVRFPCNFCIFAPEIANIVIA